MRWYCGLTKLRAQSVFCPGIRIQAQKNRFCKNAGKNAASWKIWPGKVSGPGSSLTSTKKNICMHWVRRARPFRCGEPPGISPARTATPCRCSCLIRVTEFFLRQHLPYFAVTFLPTVPISMPTVKSSWIIILSPEKERTQY